MKNFKGYEGKIYCFTHTPKPSATTVTDSVALKTALNAPKKTSEGLGTVQKGSGGKPQIAVFGSDDLTASGGGSSASVTQSSHTDYSSEQVEEPAAEYGGEAVYEEQQEEAVYEEEETYDE